MTEPGAPDTIYRVILEIQSERPILAKTRTGQVGNQKTRYADLVQVNEVVLKRLNELNAIWTCRPHFEDGAFGLHYSLRHVPSGTEVAGVWPLKWSDNPQQLGSAVTYGRRYALLAVTGIVAEDDDDDGAAAGRQRTARRQTSRPAEPTPDPRPTTPIQRANRPAPAKTAELISPGQSSMMHALFNGLGITKDERAERLAITAQVIGHDVTTSNELTKVEATKVIEHLQSRTEPLPDEPPLDDA